MRLFKSQRARNRLKDLHLQFLESRLHATFGDARLTAYEIDNGGVKMTLFSSLLYAWDMPMIGIGSHRRPSTAEIMGMRLANG